MVDGGFCVRCVLVSQRKKLENDLRKTTKKNPGKTRGKPEEKLMRKNTRRIGKPGKPGGKPGKCVHENAPYRRSFSQKTNNQEHENISLQKTDK
jgi:hypothetical protein